MSDRVTSTTFPSKSRTIASTTLQGEESSTVEPISTTSFLPRKSPRTSVTTSNHDADAPEGPATLEQFILSGMTIKTTTHTQQQQQRFDDTETRRFVESLSPTQEEDTGTAAKDSEHEHNFGEDDVHYHFDFSNLDDLGNEKSESEADDDMRSSAVSNNPQGCHGSQLREELSSVAQCQRALCFTHPTSTRCPYACEGIHLNAQEQLHDGMVKRRIVPIQQLRLMYEYDKVSKKHPSQKLLDTLWEQHDEMHGESQRMTLVTEMTWRVGDRRVCHTCWAAAAGFLTHPTMERRKQSYTLALSVYYSGKRTIPVLAKKKRGQGRGTKRDTVKAWVQQYVSEDAGNAQQKTTDDAQHLQGMSGSSLYDEYCAWHAKQVGLPATGSVHTFRRALKDMEATHQLPDSLREFVLHKVRFHKHKTQQECAVCSGLQILMDRAKAAKVDKASAKRRWTILKEKLALHHWICKLERSGEHVRNMKGRQKKGVLAGAADGFDSFKSANFTYRGKPMSDMKGTGVSDAKGYVFKTQGVLLQAWGYYLYVLDPTIAANANFSIECLHRTLHKFFEQLRADPDAEWPSEFYFQVDGAPDNKCRAMFMYAEYLVRCGVFDVVIISFLIVGHTHNCVDQTFSEITFELRKRCVKQLTDLVSAYNDAYKLEKPKCVEVVRSVGDYTKWLVEAKGKTFKGFARRVPDHCRPHQFIFKRDVDGASMDYKNLSVDKTVWNEGQAPIRLLSGEPEPCGPSMQPPTAPTQKVHLTKWAGMRQNVFAHFNMRVDEELLFTTEEIKYTTDLFDLFSTPIGELLDLDSSPLMKRMRADYKWLALPKREHVMEDVADLVKHVRGVPPIVHSGYTDAEYQRAKKEAEEDAAANTEEQVTTARMGRGRHDCSAAVLQTMKMIERDLKKVTAEAKQVPPPTVKDACIIVGAYKHPKVEMVYLVDWVNYVGEGKVQWLPSSEVDNFMSLNDKMVDETIFVWWGMGVNATIDTSSPWRGEITDFIGGDGCSSREVSDKDDSHDSDDDDIPLKDLGGSSRNAPRASNGEHVVQVQYDDGNVDLLDLRTLAFEKVVCDDDRKQVIRVGWLLSEYNTKASQDSLAELLGIKRQAPSPVVASGDVQPANSRRPQETNTRSSMRKRKPATAFNPSVDGANDKQRRCM